MPMASIILVFLGELVICNQVTRTLKKRRSHFFAYDLLGWIANRQKKRRIAGMRLMRFKLNTLMVIRS